MPKYLSGTYLVLEHNNERQQMWEAVFFSSDNKANRSRSRVKGIRGTSSVYCLSVKKLMCGTIFHNLSFVIKCSKKRRCCYLLFCCELLWPHIIKLQFIKIRKEVMSNLSYFKKFCILFHLNSQDNFSFVSKEW